MSSILPLKKSWSNNELAPILTGFELVGINDANNQSFSVQKTVDGQLGGTKPDLDTTIRVVFNLGDEFPDLILASIKNGVYQIRVVGGIYQVSVQGTALDHIAYSGDCQIFSNCPTEIAASVSKNVWAIRSMGRSSTSLVPDLYQNLMPSSERAWWALESNSEILNLTQVINRDGTVRLNGIAGPHFLPDGVTLNEGYARLVMTTETLTDYMNITAQQAISGSLSIESDIDVTSPIRPRILNEDFVDIDFGTFHYSTHNIFIKPSSTMKSSKITWFGKKSSVKRNRTLTVKAIVKSNKKKAAGSIRVNLINSKGEVVASKTARVKKGIGKASFSKAFTKVLPKGRYIVRIDFFGLRTAKTAMRSYWVTVR